MFNLRQNQNYYCILENLELLLVILASSDLKYTTDPEALCLDVTQYLELGSGIGINKWLIWFEGSNYIEARDYEETK